jgi:hypothetical protein
MRKPRLSAVIALAAIVSASAVASLGQKSAHRPDPASADGDATASFTPPPEPGQIFTVINFRRAEGQAQNTRVSIDWGAASRSFVVGAPYRGICSTSTPSGFVLKQRHPRPDQVPLTITTDGTIVRGPYQGDPPLELLNSCYRLAS